MSILATASAPAPRPRPLMLRGAAVDSPEMAAKPPREAAKYGKWVQASPGADQQIGRKIGARGVPEMSGSIVVFLILVAAVVLLGVVRTVVVVLRDGRGRNPREPSEPPWMAGNLPSVPYSVWRL
ncbi:hypothetical protein ACX80S_17695 [Arthrobacter sp. RHLT1-20]